jgi:iron-sulfur cluster repair protein YtfE (RIC family)
MATITQPLRDEHSELLPELETLRVAAEAAGTLPPRELSRLVDMAYEFLAYHLIPHAQAEDRALYPVVGRAMGAAEATATMSRDHVEVGRLTEELSSLRSAVAAGQVGEGETRDLRRVLYGLYALVRLHFAKEEEIYLPILDARLSASEAADMFDAMEREAADAKASTTT